MRRGGCAACARGGGCVPGSGRGSIRAVQGKHRVRLRAPDGAARPQRRHARDDHVGAPPPPRARRRSAFRGDRAGRRAGAVGDPVRGNLHRTARADPRHARPNRVRPARHRLLAPAGMPRLRTARRLPQRRAAAQIVRRTDRPRTRLLHLRGLRRRHRGAAQGAGLRKASVVGHLVRHQGGGGVRAAVPRTRRSAGARLGRAANRAGPARPHHIRSDPAHPEPIVRVRPVRPDHAQPGRQPRAAGKAHERRGGERALRRPARHAPSRSRSPPTSCSTSCSPATSTRSCAPNSRPR